MKTRSLPVLAWLLISLPAGAADWPQWRGPDRTGVSAETGLLKSWPKEGPKLLWTYSETGLGYSGPAIVGDRLYTMGARGQTEFVIALDTQQGKELWAAEVGSIFQFKGNVWGDGPRSTPTVDGAHLYALGGQGELICLETATGKKVWQHNLFKEFHGYVMDNNGPEQTGWGYTEGPLVDGHRVVVTPGGDDGTLLAFDKQTANVLWRTKEVKDKAPYSSIIVGEVGGVRQYIQLTSGGVVGVAPEDGRLLWRYHKPNDDLVIRTPIFHDNCVFATYSFGQGSDLIQIIGDAKGFQAKKVYANKNMKNEMGGVVLVGDQLYGYSRGGGWTCMNFKKGDVRWSEKRKLGEGSLICADGHLYCYGDENGIVVLAEASPKKWQESGRFKIPQESKNHAPNARIWTHPVVANGHLYLRDQELLFCYDIKEQAASGR